MFQNGLTLSVATFQKGSDKAIRPAYAQPINIKEVEHMAHSVRRIVLAATFALTLGFPLATGAALAATPVPTTSPAASTSPAPTTVPVVAPTPDPTHALTPIGASDPFSQLFAFIVGVLIRVAIVAATVGFMASGIRAIGASITGQAQGLSHAWGYALGSVIGLVIVIVANPAIQNIALSMAGVWQPGLSIPANMI
ncbi:MAG: hypothetical protein ACYDAG_04300 [Chloroflexota bacterium]